MDGRIRVGIIGLGNMGAGHARSIIEGKCPELTLAAIANDNAERLTWARENPSPDLKCFEDAVQMLDSGLIEACIVCTPHYDHPKYAVACMERGIHVMVEKPAGVYTKQARQMNEAAKAHPDVVFGMMFNQRTNCVYRKLRKLVQSGDYGQLRRANWIITNWHRPQCYYDSGSWRATWAGEGSGVLLNQCPHQLDLWQWILGMPARLHSHMRFGQWHDIEVEDDVTTYMEYENGATGVLVTSTGDAHGTNRLEVQLDRARLIMENDKLSLLEYAVSEPEWSKTNKAPFATMPAREVEVQTDGQNAQHVGVLNAWAGAILRGEPLVAPGEEGINGLMLSNAMHLSAFLGQPVELPIDEDLYYDELMKRVANSRRKAESPSVFADTRGSYGGV